jgi:hypothetical protein
MLHSGALVLADFFILTTALFDPGIPVSVLKAAVPGEPSRLPAAPPPYFV